MKKKIAMLLSGLLFLGNTGALAVEDVIANNIGYKTEHLMQEKDVSKKTPTNLVLTTPTLNTVIEYNVIEVMFAENFSTRTAKVGDRIGFPISGGLKTTEGTVVLPEGSKLEAEVTGIIKPKSFNRSGKVMLNFDRVITPDGKVIPFSGKLYSEKQFLSRGKANALGKGLASTLGAGAIGIGAGCGIGVAASAVIIGGFAIGLPVGIAVGALAGFVTPGLHYKAKPGDKILIQLTDNLKVQHD